MQSQEKRTAVYVVGGKMLAAIWVTTACNMRCRYCYEGDSKPAVMLDKGTALKVLEFIFDKAKKEKTEAVRIVFHGGEPLLNYEVIRFIIHQVKEKYSAFHTVYGITINGLCLEKEKIKFLAENIQDITVSLDGMKETHDRNRVDVFGQGTYNQIIDGFLALKEQKEEIRLRMTVTSNTVRQLYDNIVYLVSVGFKVIIPGIDYGDSNWTEETMELLQKQLIKIKEYIKEQCNEKIYVAMLESEEIRGKGMCTGGRDSFHISPEGDIYPCVYTVGEKFYCCGNVWSGVQKKKLEEFDRINRKHIKECSGCSLYHFCSSVRCKFINEKLTGDYYKPSPAVCSVENIKFRINCTCEA